MFERDWKNPREVKRTHAGVYTLKPMDTWIRVGDEVGLECIKVKNRLLLGVYAPLRIHVLRESQVKKPEFHPYLLLKDDPHKIVRHGIRLGDEEGVDNRLYIGAEISVARIPELNPGSIDVIISIAGKKEITPYPFYIDPKAEFRVVSQD